MNFITEASGRIAQTAAHRPIHFMVIPALLASIAYLSIIDDYVPEHIRTQYKTGVSYYHPQGSASDLDKWIEIHDTTEYANANQISVIPLRFRRFHDAIPHIPNAIKISNNEQILIVPSENAGSTLEGLSVFTENGVTWKARNNDKISKYYDYARYGFRKIQDAIHNADNFDIILVFVAYQIGRASCRERV